MMVEARWNGARIASSDDTIIVEGNHYFPAESVDATLLRPSETTTVCPWKGTAHYYSLHVAGADNPDAAWYYPDPKSAADAIRGRIAFWKGVTVGRSEAFVSTVGARAARRLGPAFRIGASPA